MEIKYYKETINEITYDVMYEENNFKKYFLNNKRHNETGPAEIWYCEDDNVRFKKYWINNKCLYTINY